MSAASPATLQICDEVVADAYRSFTVSRAVARPPANPARILSLSDRESRFEIL
jgi:hypothetical protein